MSDMRTDPASEDAVRLSAVWLCKKDTTSAASSSVSCAHTFDLGAETEGALACQPVPVNDVGSREPGGRLAAARCACFEPGLPTRGTFALTSAAADSASQNVLVRIALDWRHWQKEDQKAQEASSLLWRTFISLRVCQSRTAGRVRTSAISDWRDKRGPLITPTSSYGLGV